jgi:SAM-dependent methyltransferase
MPIQELDFLITLLKPRSKILEIGCSNGYITEYIHDNTQSDVLGLDYSDVAIAQAQARTKDKAKTLRFARVDLTQDDIPGRDYDHVILIDSIYFMGDYRETLKRISAKLSQAGSMVIAVFQVVEEDELEGDLSADDTHLAQALKELGFEYDWYDFTANVRLHGIKNYQVGEELGAAFEREGNEFLYQARVAENRFFKEHAEKGTIFRYMYVTRNALAEA